MSMLSATPSPTTFVVSAFERAVTIARRFPDSVLLAMGRVAIAGVFWNSAMSKLASWDSTLALFRDEYRVPVLPTELAAVMGTGAELIGAVLLFFGLGARFAALALLGVTAVIQIFVYPESWVHHLQWATILLLVLVKGAGRLSLDHLILTMFRRHTQAAR
jgi:putative oxidoreductase